MKKYFVTFGSTRSKCGPNPFGHNCLLLSEMDEASGKLKVANVWGFYGEPSPAEEKSWARWLKIQIGFDIDFWGNHGFLMHEEPRYLESNSDYKLFGHTFELTEAQYELLSANCNKMHDEQNAAIAEAAKALGLEPKSLESTKTYPYEHQSREIFAHEQQKNPDAPRLKPFDINLSWPLWSWRPNTHNSHNCKTQAISLLAEVLTVQQIATITEQGKHPTVPRFSGPGEYLYLHCNGPLATHQKKKGKALYHETFGYGTNSGVECYFTVLPQFIDGTGKTMQLLQINPVLIEPIKAAVDKLQRLRWVFLNARLTEDHPLLKKIIASYEAFSFISVADRRNHPGGVHESPSSYFSFFSKPVLSERDIHLQGKLKDAEELLSLLYKTIEHSGNVSGSDMAIAQVVSPVASLPRAVQENICIVLGEAYPESIWDEEDIQNAYLTAG